jgi:hypothetical protein
MPTCCRLCNWLKHEPGSELSSTHLQVKSGRDAAGSAELVSAPSLDVDLKAAASAPPDLRPEPSADDASAADGGRRRVAFSPSVKTPRVTLRPNRAANMARSASADSAGAAAHAGAAAGAASGNESGTHSGGRTMSGGHSFVSQGSAMGDLGHMGGGSTLGAASSVGGKGQMNSPGGQLWPMAAHARSMSHGGMQDPNMLNMQMMQQRQHQAMLAQYQQQQQAMGMGRGMHNMGPMGVGNNMGMGQMGQMPMMGMGGNMGQMQYNVGMGGMNNMGNMGMGHMMPQMPMGPMHSPPMMPGAQPAAAHMQPQKLMQHRQQEARFSSNALHKHSPESKAHGRLNSAGVPNNSMGSMGNMVHMSPGGMGQMPGYGMPGMYPNMYTMGQGMPGMQNIQGLPQHQHQHQHQHHHRPVSGSMPRTGSAQMARVGSTSSQRSGGMARKDSAKMSRTNSAKMSRKNSSASTTAKQPSTGSAIAPPWPGKESSAGKVRLLPLASCASFEHSTLCGTSGHIVNV